MQMIAPTRPTRLAVGVFAASVAVALCAPLVLSPFGLRVCHTIFFGSGVALSWFILGGFAGYFSFGHTVFVGIGAFAAALVLGYAPSAHWAAQISIAIFAGSACCAIVAAAVAWPILRLRGHYFTIAMLAVALVIAEIVNSFSVFQGAVGIAIRIAEPESIRPELFYYYLLLIATIFAALVVFAVGQSKLGYGLMSIRENEDAAEMLGVPTALQKSLCFVISAAVCGVFGAILALNLGYITTDSVFRGQISLEVIVYCLLGGMGSIAGPIIGAIVFTVATKVIFSSFLEIHLALTGVILIVVVLAAPDGIIGSVGRAGAALRVWRRERVASGAGEQA